MMIEKIENIKTENEEKERIKNNTLERLKRILTVYTKMPDSWIESSEYIVYTNEEKEELQKKLKNKFRISYFNSLGGTLLILTKFIQNNKEKVNYLDKIKNILEKVKKEHNQNRKISEIYIDEIDNLAKEIIDILEKNNEEK